MRFFFFFTIYLPFHVPVVIMLLIVDVKHCVILPRIVCVGMYEM